MFKNSQQAVRALKDTFANVVGRRNRRLIVGRAAWSGVRVAFLMLGIVLLAATPASSLEPKWPSGPYRYLVIDQDVKDVLVEFGRNIGVPTRVSDQVSGRMRGRVPVTSAHEFLNLLCERNGLVWYFDGAVLNVGAETEVKTELVNIGSLPAGELLAKLDTLGIADQRFPVRTTLDAGIISVSGPPAFISLVQQTIAAMSKSAAQPPREGDQHPGVRVFRGGAT
jgi:type II secretory pathway component GspD/PulD (secretin)